MPITSVVMYTCDPSTGEEEAGRGSEVQVHPQQQSEFKCSLVSVHEHANTTHTHHMLTCTYMFTPYIHTYACIRNTHSHRFTYTCIHHICMQASHTPHAHMNTHERAHHILTCTHMYTTCIHTYACICHIYTTQIHTHMHTPHTPHIHMHLYMYTTYAHIYAYNTHVYITYVCIYL